jgi:hypothetical protein
MALAAIAAVMGTGAWAGVKMEEQKLAVCMEEGSHADAVTAATAVVSRLLKPAGVKIDWHTDASFCRTQQTQVITVSLSDNTPGEFHPGALAFALPYEGVHIQVFYDRIARSNDDLLPYLLAHVVVHEITHVLQGIDRHSANGIMKAHWNRDDFAQMRKGQLSFAALDIELVRDGLAARANHRQVVATAVAP